MSRFVLTRDLRHLPPRLSFVVGRNLHLCVIGVYHGQANGFYETDVFTARIAELIDDESYTALQAVLIAAPEAGDLIPKTRGLRKIRWMGSGRGKRGGIRVIYFLVCQEEIFMLYAYPKNQESDSSPRHYQMPRELVEQHLEP